MAESATAREVSSVVGAGVGGPPIRAPSRHERRASEHAHRDLIRNRRRGQRLQRHRRALGHLPCPPRRWGRADTTEEAPLANRADPSPHREPRRRRRLPHHTPRTHPATYLRERKSDDTEQPQGQTDRASRVVPTSKHSTRPHHDQRSTLLAPVTSLTDHHRPRPPAGFERTPLLTLPQTVPPQSEPSPHRPARHPARRTPTRPCLLRRWHSRKPRLDVEAARDDPLLASVAPVFSHLVVRPEHDGGCGRSPPRPLPLVRLRTPPSPLLLPHQRAGLTSSGSMMGRELHPLIQSVRKPTSEPHTTRAGIVVTGIKAA